MFVKNEICECGKFHDAKVDEIIIEKGAINKIVHLISKYNAKKPFVVADKNTFSVAGELLEEIFNNHKVAFSKFIFAKDNLEPNEESVGSLIMHYDSSCDIIVGVGSGVINDLSKILANSTNNPYIIVATAPSMDGYASATSSVTLDGLKVSLASKCANVVIGDIDILKTAPEKMLVSGLGDMLAKYISICEWKISHIITNEYYCEKVANLVKDALKKCVDNASLLLSKDEEAIKAVFEGLVLGGVAMNYAGLSRPASGVEHYFSHIFDMRALEFNTASDLHGIQCGIGTLYAIKIYEQIKKIKIDKQKALDYVKNFDYENYKKELICFFGKGAHAMIELEKKEGKYNIKKHKERLEIIIENWQKIIDIINEEIPSYQKIENLLDSLNAPKYANEIGIDKNTLPFTFKATKDIRDKYVLSRLCWDLGIIDQIEI